MPHVDNWPLSAELMVLGWEFIHLLMTDANNLDPDQDPIFQAVCYQNNFSAVTDLQTFQFDFNR